MFVEKKKPREKRGENDTPVRFPFILNDRMWRQKMMVSCSYRMVPKGHGHSWMREI